MTGITVRYFVLCPAFPGVAGKCIVAVDPRYFRPAEVDSLLGDATKARLETGEKMVSVLIPRIVQVCKELAGKE